MNCVRDCNTAYQPLECLCMEYMETTDKRRGLRDRPETHWVYRISVLMLDWLWPRLWIDQCQPPG